MAGEWKTLPLQDCMAAIIDYRGKTPDKKTFGIPLVTAKVIKGGRIERPDEFIAEADFDAWMRRGMPETGDIVMTTEAPLGEIAQLDGKKVALAQRVITLRGKPGLLDNTFLKFLLQSHPVQEELKSRATGTTVLGIRQSELRKVNLTLPPFPEQKAIASVLGSLDDLIDLNRETNEILEEMARALFKSWFVDFDPVRAKLEGRSPAGMDAATAALFPAHFQDSELGQIPKGWEVVALGSVLGTLETGRRPKGGVAGYSSGVPSVGAESINGIGVFDFSKTKYIPHEFYEKTKSGRIQNLDVLLYKDGGKPGEFRPRVGLYGYDFPFKEFCINEHVFRMRADSVGQHYLYFTISDERVLLDFANKGGKAAIPGINQTDVRSTLILLPPQSVLAEFEKQAQPICQSIIENFAESRDLATLRDTLLPKLLSGEVSAPAAEELIAAST